MNAESDHPGAKTPGPTPESIGETSELKSNVRVHPRIKHYVILNLAAWAFLAFQTAIVIYFLGTSRLVYLLTFFLGAAFAAISAFDYFWLRFFK